MGRSNLQGTPWHYEYLHGNNKSNSKNCAFNTGSKCICKISINHNNLCVVKQNCDDFERCSFNRPNINKPTKVNHNQNQKTKKRNFINQPPKGSIKLGDKIIVESQSTHEKIELHNRR